MTEIVWPAKQTNIIYYQAPYRSLLAPHLEKGKGRCFLLSCPLVSREVWLVKSLFLKVGSRQHKIKPVRVTLGTMGVPLPQKGPRNRNREKTASTRTLWLPYLRGALGRSAGTGRPP